MKFGNPVVLVKHGSGLRFGPPATRRAMRVDEPQTITLSGVTTDWTGYMDALYKRMALSGSGYYDPRTSAT